MPCYVTSVVWASSKPAASTTTTGQADNNKQGKPPQADNNKQGSPHRLSSETRVSNKLYLRGLPRFMSIYLPFYGPVHYAGLGYQVIYTSSTSTYP